MAGPSVEPFTPNSSTAQIAATTSTGSVALGGSGPQIEVTNEGPNTAFVAFGGSGVTAAAATGYPVLAGQSKAVSSGKKTSVTHAAAITASGTATVYFTMGDGQ